MNKTPAGWAAMHCGFGHNATTTQIAAPGTGIGSYCWTCKEYGPSTGRILTPEEVR